MQYRVNSMKIESSRKFREYVLGVAQDPLDDSVWMEFSSTKPKIPPLFLQIWKGGVTWRVRHSCSTLREKRGVCWHLGAAVDLASGALSGASPTGTQVVDVSDEHPERPGGPLTDLTPRVLGTVYNGSKLLAVLVPEAAGVPSPTGLDPEGEPAVQDPIFTPASGGAESGTGVVPGYGASLMLNSEADRVRRYLTSEGMPPALIEQVVTVRRADVPPQYQERVPRETRFTGLAEILKVALVAFLLGKNILAVGPKSSGKTTLIYTLAWVFGLPLFEINGHLMTEVADLRGDKTLEANESGQVTVHYVLGTIAEAMAAGGIGYVDEFTNIREGVAVWLNGLDWRRSTDIPGYGVVRADPRFRLALAGNKGYAGCTTPNEATVDRAVVIEMPYSERIAAIILDESKNKNNRTATQLEEFFRRIRDAIEARELKSETAMTVRGLIDAADLMTLGVPARVALRCTVVSKMWDDSVRDRAKVEQTIDAMFPAG